MIGLHLDHVRVELGFGVVKLLVEAEEVPKSLILKPLIFHMTFCMPVHGFLGTNAHRLASSRL